MSLETILVAGAAGFIGSHAAEALMQRGCRVIGVDNFCDFYDRSWKEMNIKTAALKGRIDVEEIDITDGPGISRLVSAKTSDGRPIRSAISSISRSGR